MSKQGQGHQAHHRPQKHLGLATEIEDPPTRVLNWQALQHKPLLSKSLQDSLNLGNETTCWTQKFSTWQDHCGSETIIESIQHLSWTSPDSIKASFTNLTKRAHRRAPSSSPSGSNRGKVICFKGATLDCNNFPGFRHHVGDVNQAQCRRAYTRHNSWVSMAADKLRMRLLLCQRSIQSFSIHHYTNMSHMYSHH